MDATGASATAGERDDFGAGRLFLADSRLAFVVLNHVRYAVLKRAFGVSREQANLLTFVLALGAAEGSYVTARRALRAPLRVRDSDVGIAAFSLREAALGIAGPEARAVPGFGALVAVGIVGGVALPAIRQAVRILRAEEQRVRLRRASRYAATLRAAAADARRAAWPASAPAEHSGEAVPQG